MSEKIKDMKANIVRLLSENTELKRERDEAMAVANDLASAASHCLVWHHCRLKIGEKIAATLQRWSKLKEAAK
jgi:hypothetical protein